MDSRLRKPNFVFECFVELTRPKDGEEVQVTYLFPKDYVWDDDLKKQLPKFSFPSLRSESEELQHFTFVLTDLDSKYRFGFCRYPPKLDSCTCFVSDMPWYKVFYRALDKISDLRLDHQNEVIEPFLGGLRSHSFPSPGTETLSVVPVGVDTGQVYSFPLPIPNKLPEIPADHNLTLFYTNLHYNVVLHLFANMIFERRIIITSSSLSLLSACVQGAVMILYPLHWQHIFIPITPPHLIDYCAAPMPFLMGIHSSLMNRVHQMPMDDVVILDVDESTIESPYCEDLLSLPGEVITSLKHILKKQSSAYGATVARAFMLAQVSMIGGYRSALKLRQGEKEVTFDEDAFLKSRPNMEEFLGQLLHFQHFRQFINGRIDKLKGRSIERDLFDNEVLAYEEELKGSAQEQMKLAFQKFAASTVEGSKKLGDKLSKQAKQNYKILDKNFKSMMKETRRQFQGMKSDQKTDYRGHTIENSALVTGQLPEHKSSTLPDSRKLSSVQAQSATSSLPASTEPLKPRKPPLVIPYQRHLEGKRKLAESLRQSGIIPEASDRDRANSLSQVPVGILLNLTPPDTPRSSTSADQASLDHSERASLDSKGSTEASIASSSEEVVTGNLVDLSTSDGNPTKVGEKNGQDSDTESASTISTYSSSDEEGNGQANWEHFDDRPPLPPPRSELHHLFSSESNSGPTPVDTPLENSNPFLSATTSQTNPNPFQTSDTVGRDSPSDDFSTSIAQALFDTSRRRSDPFAATALATMSRDIYKTIAEEPLPDPLVPTSTSGNVTRHSSTVLPRSSPHVIMDRRSSEHTLGIICTQSNSAGSTPNLSVVYPSSIAPMSTSAGNSPVMSQRLATTAGTAANFHSVSTSQKSVTTAAAVTDPAYNTDIKLLPSPKKPPPPKPQPYSGGAVTFYRERQQGPQQDFGKVVSSNGGKTVNSHAYDPFGGLFGDGGMHAYASVKGNSSTTNCAQSKESPLV